MVKFLEYRLVQAMRPAGVLSDEGRVVLAVACLERFRQHGHDLLAVDRVDGTRLDAAQPSTAT